MRYESSRKREREKEASKVPAYDDSNQNRFVVIFSCVICMWECLRVVTFFGELSDLMLLLLLAVGFLVIHT